MSGISSDMRTLLESDDPAAANALDLFCYRISRELGALATALGALDAIVVAGGIGSIGRPCANRCAALVWLGILLDVAANARHGPRISTVGSAVATWVIPTNDEFMIAQHTLKRLEV